ncbi:heparinase II/III family protein [Victivallis vadensis]|uniref:heparinase II/III family protein n=1 Tax=Victivallis vadensis TaxID=172901 RepID=UPI0023F32582|nr:heparinase II/III family protein [Victivallis vadensis]
MKALFNPAAGCILLLCLSVSGAGRIGPESPRNFQNRIDAFRQACGLPGVDRQEKLTEREKGYRIDQADAICRGTVFFFRNIPTEIGLRNIDWFGGQRDHQEWIAQLNRFGMLETLATAWGQTSNDKYPLRARTLMSDWFDFWEKHGRRFLDPQQDNELNCAIRLRNWLHALAVFRNTEAFDDAFVVRLLDNAGRQADMLAARTAPGDSNWQVIQAMTLIEAGLVLDFLPNSEIWRKKGTEVLNACFVRQFRADGSHVENTFGYHYWMTREMLNAYLVGRRYPELGIGIDPAILEQALQFCRLARRFAFNDSSYTSNFPEWAKPDFDDLAKRLGSRRQPVQREVFKKAGLVFGGNEREIFCFDAGPYCGWHSHHSRLSIAYGADGCHLLIDPAITTYEKNQKSYEYGRATRSHATVNFNGANQMRSDARLAAAVLSPDYGVAVGEFDGGAFQGNFADRFIKNTEADFRRMILWLAQDYLLIFDRTAIRSSPKGETVTNYVFPAAPAEKWTLDQEGLCWYSRNLKRPNLYLRMMQKPAGQVQLACVEGREQPVLAGWTAILPEQLIPAPLVTFSADTGNRTVQAIILAAAFPAGKTPPDTSISRSMPGELDFQFGPNRDELRYSPDFLTLQPLKSGDATATTVLLLVRNKQSAFCFRAEKLIWKNREIPLPAKQFTGWLELPPNQPNTEIHHAE